jgi:hypothetical protein
MQNRTRSDPPIRTKSAPYVRYTFKADERGAGHPIAKVTAPRLITARLLQMKIGWLG